MKFKWPLKTQTLTLEEAFEEAAVKRGSIPSRVLVEAKTFSTGAEEEITTIISQEAEPTIRVMTESKEEGMREARIREVGTREEGTKEEGKVVQVNITLGHNQAIKEGDLSSEEKPGNTLISLLAPTDLTTRNSLDASDLMLLITRFRCGVKLILRLLKVSKSMQPKVVSPRPFSHKSTRQWHVLRNLRVPKLK